VPLRILLDEGVPHVIKRRLNTLSIFTVEEMGWRGIKNGALLDLMAEEFQTIVTTDKNLPFQQNLAQRRIAAVILPSNRIQTVIELLPKIESALVTISPGQFVEITISD
jgi:hypothetical protein